MQITIDKLTVRLGPKRLRDSYAYSEVRCGDYEGCPEEPPFPEDHCPACKGRLLRLLIQEACNEGVRQLVENCDDIEDLNFVEFDNFGEEIWQQFIFGEQDGEMKPTYKITVSETEEDY